MKRLILTAALLLTALSLISSNDKYVYTQISQKEGLTSTVNCIYKEKDGDVWIGTPNGLYGYNGYTLKNYSDLLFGSRRVFQTAMNGSGDLWVLTEKHILKKEADSKNFHKVSQTQGPHFCLLFDKEYTWIGCKGKIYRYSDNEVVTFPISNKSFDCRSMGKIDENTLLCCSHKGKLLLDTRSGEFSEAPFGKRNEVSATLIDHKGRIWLAHYNNGIEVYHKDGTLIKEYRSSNSSLNNDIVLCLAERDSIVLAGTDGGGINIIDIDSGTTDILSHISGDRSSFPAHSIKSIHIDHYGNIWAGSIRDGLISISQSGIRSYQDTHAGHTNGLSNPTVLCLHQEKGCESIWIGTDGEGLNRFDPATSRFTHYESTFKTKTVSIADYSDNELVLSVYADNIYIFDKLTGATRPLFIANKDLRYQMRHSGRSINLYNEADGDLLLFSNSIYRYAKSTGSCHPVKLCNGADSYSNFFILGRNNEGVWMHNNFSICLLADNADSLTLKGTHAHGIINSGHLTDDGTIWLATQEGLCRFDTHSGRFAHITTTIFSDANSVVCDNNSRVWVGTEKGLSAYLIDSENFTLFGKSDGAQPNEFLPKPHLLTDNGDVFLGGVQGLVHIESDYTIDTAEEPVLGIEEVKIDGDAVRLSEGGAYKIPRHSKSMEVSISVQEKDMFRHRVYRFSLSRQEIYETSVPVLSLRHLPSPGTYDITVSCTRRNGEWTEPVKLMRLKVPQPWFLTWWFIGSCIVVMFLIYITAILSINRRKANELKIAMQEKEQMVYEEKVQMLINISHELRTPLTLIMAPLKRLLNDSDAQREDFHILSRIYRQSRRMRNLLDMVLDLRKMEVGASRLKREKVDFNSWIAETTDDIVNEERAEGIDIVYDFGQSVGTAEIDRQKCDTILMNILINAIKHSCAGDTITISTTMTGNGMIRTSISDQGPGLGKDIDPSRLFTRFYQSNSERYGSGIGLSYSRILVQMHGGEIGAMNNESKGATFWWEIPAVAEEVDSENQPKAYLNELLGHSSEAGIEFAAAPAFSTAGMRLMIVDDNQDLLDFLRESLCQDFAEIITATGGNPALRILSQGRLPDVIVSDVNMPDGDGFAFCRELKQNEKYCHIPVVLLTARGEDQSQSESYRLGAEGFIAKPFEIETLMELLRGLLKSKADIRRKYLDNQDNAPSDYGSEEERFILQLNKIIAEHLADPDLDQQLICRELGVSRALLYNRMRAITGAGTKEYIIKLRIEKAKSLIENSSYSIAEVSDMTGFASQSYFSTAFKNYTGMTPSRYKQQCRQTNGE